MYSGVRWQKRNPSFFEWNEPEQTVVGRLAIIEEVSFGDTKRGRYTLDTPTGPVSFLGTTQLDRDLEGVIVGSLLKIVYKGELKTRGGQRFKAFEVWEEAPPEGQAPATAQKKPGLISKDEVK